MPPDHRERTRRGQSRNVELEDPLLEPPQNSMFASKRKRKKPPLPIAPLIAVYFTLFAQWVLMSMPASFLPDSDIGQLIGNTEQGLIFASLPIGCMLTAPFVPFLVHASSNRKAIIIGSILMAVFYVALGVVPFILPNAKSAYLFMAIGFLYGCGSTLAEVACGTVLTQLGSERGIVGTLVSISEVVTGVSCMLGPPMGGLIYTLGDTLELSSEWQFLFPFAAASLLPALALALVLLLMKSSPNVSEASGEVDSQRKPPRACLTPTFGYVMVCAGLVITSICYSALGATLEIRLDHLGVASSKLSSTAGLYFFLTSLMFVVMFCLIMCVGCSAL